MSALSLQGKRKIKTVEELNRLYSNTFVTLKQVRISETTNQ